MAIGSVIPAIMALGAAATAVGWRLVEARGASIWVVMGAVNAAAGAAALATRRVVFAGDLAVGRAAAAGIAAGLVFYLATVAFVLVVRRRPRFGAQVTALYARRGSRTTVTSVLFAAGLTAPGEELFWRGLFQPQLAPSLSRPGAAVLAWGVYVGTNAASLSIPITAGAVVGGAVWGGLALWTGGVLASLCCHALWTALMVGVPPPGAGGPGPADGERSP